MAENPLSFEVLTRTARPRRESDSIIDHTKRIFGDEGVELKNHGLAEVVETLFSDVDYLNWRNRSRTFVDRIRGKKEVRGYERYDGTKVEAVQLTKAPLGTEEFFDTRGPFLDLGCGGGRFPLELAARFPRMSVIGIDLAFGRQIDFPFHNHENLELRNGNWRNIPLRNGSVTRIVSHMAACLYGRPDQVGPEIDRVAKRGTLLRAQTLPGVTQKSKETGDITLPGSAYGFCTILASRGWTMWSYYDYQIIGIKN